MDVQRLKHTDFLSKSMLHTLEDVYTCVQLGSTHTVLHVYVMWCHSVHMSVQLCSQ